MDTINKSRKVLWLVNKHAVPLKFYASHARTVKLAEQFQKLGYDVYIIGASTVHNRDIDLIEDGSDFIHKEWGGVKFIHIKTRKYKGNGLSRILSFYEFAHKVSKYAHLFPRPNVVIHSTNIPFDIRIRNIAERLGAKYIAEVLDMWPDAFAAYGLIKRSSLPMKIMYQIEKRHYEKASDVVFSAEGGFQYIRDHKWDVESGGVIDMNKIHYINNGVDIESFNKDKGEYILEDEDLQSSNLFKFVYIGSIRLVNQLKLLIDAAAKLKEHSNVVFLIFGDGPDRAPLEDYCKKQNITNVKFKNKWVEPQYVPYIMCMANVNVMNYMNKAEGHYGYSQNKLFQSLASGRPICCNRGKRWSPIEQFGAGIDKEFANEDEYAEVLLRFVDMPDEEYEKMSHNALAASLLFDYKAHALNYLKIIEK